MDKRHVYDWDTRVHLLVRGPGVPPGSTWNAPATMVDLAPTFLGLAGVPKPPTMDGKSLMPLLTPHGGVPPATASHLAALGSTEGVLVNSEEGRPLTRAGLDTAAACPSRRWTPRAASARACGRARR